jgi:hypothetical protein
VIKVPPQIKVKLPTTVEITKNAAQEDGSSDPFASFLVVVEMSSFSQAKSKAARRISGLLSSRRQADSAMGLGKAGSIHRIWTTRSRTHHGGRQ